VFNSRVLEVFVVYFSKFCDEEGSIIREDGGAVKVKKGGSGKHSFR